jgi:hypothetical protein
MDDEQWNPRGEGKPDPTTPKGHRISPESFSPLLWEFLSEMKHSLGKPMEQNETILISGRIVAEFEDDANQFLSGAAELACLKQRR